MSLGTFKSGKTLVSEGEAKPNTIEQKEIRGLFFPLVRSIIETEDIFAR